MFTLVWHGDEDGYTCFFKPTSGKKDADPYFDKVR